jgi:hypothetical protein
MKLNHILLYTLFAGLLLTGCKKKREQLPAPEQASFEFTRNVDPKFPNDFNTYTFRNTTPNSFIYSWDFGGLEKSDKPVDTVFFAYQGTYHVTLLASSKGGTTSVSKDVVIEQTSPYAADFTITNTDAYHFNVAVTTPNPIKSAFKYANGAVDSTLTGTVYFPFQGTFAISLTVVTAKGNSTLTKYVTVLSDDMSNPALTDPIFMLLTGGLNSPNGNTWVLDTARFSGGVGPTSDLTTDWYNQPGGFHGSTWDDGMSSNSFTFKMRDYQYIPKNQNVTAHWAYADAFFDKSQPQYADMALVDPNHKQTPFILKNANNGIGTGYTIDFTNGSYLGYFDNRYHHEIIRINSDTLYIRHHYDDSPANNPANDGGVRYFTLIKK